MWCSQVLMEYPENEIYLPTSILGVDTVKHTQSQEHSWYFGLRPVPGPLFEMTISVP